LSEARSSSEPATVRFARVRLVAFRNIGALAFEPAPQLNVVFGDNGQGKTSLLEALYFVATTKSFRSERLTTLIQDTQRESAVSADVEESGYRREQRAALGPGGRRVTLDGKKPERLVDYAQKTPVVAFHPGDLELVSGSAAPRRRLLDRVALFVDPAGFEHRAAFERGVRERQRVLVDRGERASELDAFEAVIAKHAARYQAARVRAADALLAALEPAFAGLGPETLELAARYAPGGSTDASEVLRELGARRLLDRVRRSPSYGPGKDELELTLAGRSARAHASQGQQRLLTLSLKLAELECIRRARGVLPVLLLDDISSELDPGRTCAVYDVLRTSAGQVFVTTTRPELFPTPGEDSRVRVDFRIREGVLERAAGG
jgi:DNA replication and repair protein RecF